MRRTFIIIVLIILFVTPVYAQENLAPPVPKQAEKFMPTNQKNFTDGLLEVLQDALFSIRPDIKEATSVCMSIIAVSLATSVMHSFPGAPDKTI